MNLESITLSNSLTDYISRGILLDIRGLTCEVTWI